LSALLSSWELFAYGKTGDWAQFTAIRQDVLLKIAEIVEAYGTGDISPLETGSIQNQRPGNQSREDDTSIKG
jgi:hypothetical protein